MGEMVNIKKSGIRLKITTESNVLMGGAEGSFEIGGIDQSTVTNLEGTPYIPASAFKGMVRKIMVDDDQKDDVVTYLKNYIKNDKIKLIKQIEAQLEGEQYTKTKEEIEKKYSAVEDNIKTADLMGIPAFQRMPKLLFSDFIVEDGQEKFFSIDAKNTIKEENSELKSNPRTYKTIRKGITFKGEIRLYNFNVFKEEETQEITDYIKKILKKFNEGSYRIGNSKSRGYGKIHVEIVEDNGDRDENN